jgi:SAM-dependent methyltransferase
MPPIELWEGFFDPDSVLRALGCDGLPGDVVEFGCGYGTFTVAAAGRFVGNVYAADIDPLMMRATRERAREAGVKNVIVETRDFLAGGCGRPHESASFVILFNILHIEDPVRLLREAHSVLRVGGVAGIVHWRHDIETSRRPSLGIRPLPGQCRAWAEEAGLRWLGSPELPQNRWHWGMMLERPVRQPIQ